MLCKACSKIWSAVRTRPPGSWEGTEPSMFEYPRLDNAWSGAHHVMPGDFWVAANEQRCYVCCTIYRDCSSELRKQAAGFRLFYQIRLLTDGKHHRHGNDRYQLEFTVEVHQTQGSAPVYGDGIFECTGSFRILPRTDISVPSEPLGLTEYTFHPKCREQVQSWLENCTTSSLHRQCQQKWFDRKRFPTRLINVAQEGRFHLESFEGEIAGPEYVTLSHCWDHDAMKMKLEKATHDLLRTGLPMSALPVRFKDAVEIARWMKKTHIWIDALCIMQDSPRDWLEESARMGDIYANSYCNIAATNAGPKQGCFTKRITEMVEPYGVTNPGLDDPTATHVLGYDDFWSNSLLDTPLHNRGWVLQERLLSPRTIHFGQEQIFWECRCEMACEAYPKGIPEQFRNHKMRKWRLTDSLFDSRLDVVQPSEAISTAAHLTKVYRTWSRTIERYMECKLSHQQDKLIAISGVAQKIAMITGERYLAGLWDNAMLPQSLLWFVLAQQQSDSTPAVRMTGPDYRGPTWSWASMEAHVVWNWPVQCDKILINVVETRIEEVKGGTLGQVSSANMTLTGNLFGADLTVMSAGPDGILQEDGQYSLQLRSGEHDMSSPEAKLSASSMLPTIYLDVPMTPDAVSMAVHLLPVCTEWDGQLGTSVSTIGGLILRKTQSSISEYTYERVGVFGMDQIQAQSLYEIQVGKFDNFERALSAAPQNLVLLE